MDWMLVYSYIRGCGDIVCIDWMLAYSCIGGYGGHLVWVTEGPTLTIFSISPYTENALIINFYTTIIIY